MKVDYSQYELSVKEKAKFLAAGYVVSFAVLFLFYHSIPFSLAGGFLPYFLIDRYENYLAGKRRALLTTQFKDLLYSLSASAAVNQQIGEALKSSLDNLSLIYSPKTPLIEELKHMVKAISENRESDIRLLMDFAERSHCEDIDNFVQVYMTCRTMGGDLEKMLKSTTEILVDKINIEREIKTMTAQKKFEGKIISVMPLIVILFLNVFSPDYLEPLYTTLAGRMIMTIAIAGLGAAFYLTERLTDIEV
ncbi:type II secretion system F family protein [Ihubacter massiliensis]|uniref:Type II secretion system F family protein n=1 Tax=Hominibacterium faecale TaxID=2839743 RepID=A0A9J6R033_9FIRM|nr:MULTISPECIES: type II secretion system F family protein [Eubacteriales Family XIII. Incertae Sedis]MCI7300152.1 type II secretion system F family protein [Clostridia bacterium]MDE8732617.1 type II secretion system F family protein [Eubacteriales bacterium DFI.9.88]MDY3013059.1 type II secretion system F family protein [Clostridiales Family XIII bacterium]MCO7121182.1 type II secretion system F family protein [Ihubacter massiliensis]MCU7381058.1 type II secretion system F family protein [Hom